MQVRSGPAWSSLKRLSRVAGVVFLSACVTSQPYLRAEDDVETHTIANLGRAAKLPWRDEGQCVVQNASLTWPEIAERCYDALDLERIRFQDTAGRCAVSQAGALAMPVVRAVGVCLIAQPELLVGVVIVVGLVATAVLIKEALARREVYTEEDVRRRVGRAPPITKPTASPEPSPSPEPKSQPTPAGRDVFPGPPTTGPANCKIQPVCPRPVKDQAHDDCADNVPPNEYRGCDVLVNGKRFDALQKGTRVLWEIKTDRFDTYAPFLKDQVLVDQVQEFQRERHLATACGYDFVVGVSVEAHKVAIENIDRTLTVVVTGCRR